MKKPIVHTKFINNLTLNSEFIEDVYTSLTQQSPPTFTPSWHTPGVKPGKHFLNINTLVMQKLSIIGANPYTRNNREMVALQLTNSKVVHVSQKQMSQRGFSSSDIFNLAGSTVHVEFFNKGEKLLNDEECTDSGVIVKNFSIEKSFNLLVAGEVAKSLASQLLGSVPAPATSVAQPVEALPFDVADED